MTLADNHLTGWWIGYTIGIVVVLAVATLVILITLTVRRIAAVAEDATEALRQAKDRTDALWRLGTTAQVAQEIVTGASQARGALGGRR